METSSRLLPRLVWPLSNQSAVSWPAGTRPEIKQYLNYYSLKKIELRSGVNIVAEKFEVH